MLAFSNTKVIVHTIKLNAVCQLLIYFQQKILTSDFVDMNDFPHFYGSFHVCYVFHLNLCHLQSHSSSQINITPLIPNTCPTSTLIHIHIVSQTRLPISRYFPVLILRQTCAPATSTRRFLLPSDFTVL